jgi:propanol-preferring alcohol dehydrogenase
MKAMLLKKITDLRLDQEPLELSEMAVPSPSGDEVLVSIKACGVCHTELDEIEGRMAPPELPVIPGHQVVGTVLETGGRVKKLKKGDRVGVAWIYSSCGKCEYCLSGNENLCADFRATGRDANGGYAEYMTVKEDFAHLIPEQFSDVEAAPLLCAGAIGYRSLRLAGFYHQGSASGNSKALPVVPKALGLTGFGASAHLVLKMVMHRFPSTGVYVFARNKSEQEFALELGATWAGDPIDHSPLKLDVVIDTTPVWKPVVEAMKNLRPGGRLVINAIRKENLDKEYLMKLDYSRDLWMEKEIKSVANVAINDVREFLTLAADIPLHPEVQVYPLRDANKALVELKQQKIRGAKVLEI